MAKGEYNMGIGKDHMSHSHRVSCAPAGWTAVLDFFTGVATEGDPAEGEEYEHNQDAE